ncbi:hypothetical protein BXZ70DRAFT_628977 [Cristinia sonorae]|uniref:Uncharacterized protein n=1 Tax=Cristinia sonorae TaxID=1940300 RepID=A0A8K0XKP4_9AGAR|nr:hypothetical protein BXZ70DRAFT_628977 [Cristinia sonorae]
MMRLMAYISFQVLFVRVQHRDKWEALVREATSQAWLDWLISCPAIVSTTPGERQGGFVYPYNTAVRMKWKGLTKCIIESGVPLWFTYGSLPFARDNLYGSNAPLSVRLTMDDMTDLCNYSPVTPATSLPMDIDYIAQPSVKPEPELKRSSQELNNKTPPEYFRPVKKARKETDTEDDKMDVYPPHTSNTAADAKSTTPLTASKQHQPPPKSMQHSRTSGYSTTATDFSVAAPMNVVPPHITVSKQPLPTPSSSRRSRSPLVSMTVKTGPHPPVPTMAPPVLKHPLPPRPTSPSAKAPLQTRPPPRPNAEARTPIIPPAVNAVADPAPTSLLTPAFKSPASPAPVPPAAASDLAVTSTSAYVWQNPNSFRDILLYHYGIDQSNPLPNAEKPLKDPGLTLGWKGIDIDEELVQAAAQLPQPRVPQDYDRFLVHGNQPVTRVSRYTYAPSSEEGCSGDFYVFELSPGFEDGMWLVIHDVEIVLHVLRRWRHLQTEAIIAALVEQMMAFTIYHPQPQIPEGPPTFFQEPSWDIELPFVPEGRQPGAKEFEKYVKDVRQYLKTPSRRLAATFHGGLISRIACMIADDDDFITITQPTNQGCPDGAQIQQLQDGREVWAYTLDEKEIRFICGVYLDDTAGNRTPQQVSWWPKPPIWNTCGLHCGHWTPSCENWFLCRWAQLSAGTTKPWNRKTWVNYLKYSKTTLNTVKVPHNAFSSALLASVLP